MYSFGETVGNIDEPLLLSCGSSGGMVRIVWLHILFFL